MLDWPQGKMKWAHCLQNIYGLDSYHGNVPHVCHFTVSHPCYRGSNIRIDKEAQLLLGWSWRLLDCRRNCVIWALLCWEPDKDKGRSCFWIYKIIPLAVPTDGAALANQASCPLLGFSLNGAINSRNKVHGLLSLYDYLCCNKCRGA